MLTEDERAPPLLAATLRVTEPLPLPLVLEVNVIQLVPLLAVHAQPAIVDTVTVSVPPAAPIEALVGLTE
jgi:hypothetical protein